MVPHQAPGAAAQRFMLVVQLWMGRAQARPFLIPGRCDVDGCFAKLLQRIDEQCTLWRSMSFATASCSRIRSDEGRMQAGGRRRQAPGKVCEMPVQVTFCRLCSRSRPAFLAALQRLAVDYPDDLIVVELECMAACDDVPAVMLDTDYFPQVTPDDLVARIRARMAETLRSS